MLEFGNGELDRIESNDDTIEKCFATLLFDNNNPNYIWRATRNRKLQLFNTNRTTRTNKTY